MNQLANVLLVAAAAALGVVSLIEDLPILRDLATFFALGGLLGGAVVYRAELTWPDYTGELGRFTAVRTGGLEGQTFEIELVTTLAPRSPVFLRGYVTATSVLTRESPDRLDEYVRELNHIMERAGRCESPPFPEGCTPLFALELTTHEGHFMGRGLNRLLVYEHDGRAFVRAAGTWDELSLSLEAVYRAAGRDAQQAFWGGERAEQNMLRQIALRTEGS